MSVSVSALISPAELHSLLQKPDAKVIVLDATYAIGANGLAPETVFQQMRIGLAQFFDIDAIADQTNPLPHMLPAPEDFAQAVGQLGVSNDHLVVTYDQSGIAMASARAWWMFRVFGHDNVRVLDGGLPAWVSAGLPLSTLSPLHPAPQNFASSFRPELVKSYDDMREILSAGAATILDARPAERYAGMAPEPRPGLDAGHIPGSHSVPAGSLTDPGSRRLLPAALTAPAFEELLMSKDSPVVATCGSGVTACVIALSLFDQGYKDVAVYDGSWSEWGLKELDSPIVKGFE